MKCFASFFTVNNQFLLNAFNILLFILNLLVINYLNIYLEDIDEEVLFFGLKKDDKQERRRNFSCANGLFKELPPICSQKIN